MSDPTSSVVPTPTYPTTPRVAFFVHAEWAMGAIHSGLVKELYKRGIHANMLDWNKQYNREEIESFVDLYDSIVTVPGNAIPILNTYGIPFEKMIGVFHGRYDIQSGLAHNNPFNKLKKVGAVSPDLVEFAHNHGIDCDISVAKNGIHFDYFYQKPSQQLNTIGYGGALEYKNIYNNKIDLKRGYLVKEVSEKLRIPVNLVSPRHFLSMPTYYKGVDCVMVSSTEESCGLPLMEGAAAGRLPISTKVGVARDYQNAPGVVVPMDEDKFVSSSVFKMSQLMFNNSKFHRMCVDAQEYARMHYDWSSRIDDWIKLLTE